MRAPREPLADLQDFLAGVFQLPSPIQDDPALAESCARHVSGNDRLSPAEQVDIYRRQFWLRHVDSVAEDLPGLRWLLDEDTFDAFCRAYLTAHPPRTPSLRDLTADIAAFAARWDGFPPERRALAVEMARYEIVLVDVFDGPDVPPIAAAKLAAVPEDAWDRARIVLHPILRLMRLEFPVHRLRYAVREGLEPELPTAPEPCRIAVFRRDLVIRFDELEPLAFEVLEALAAGEPLAEAMSSVAARNGPSAEAELEARVGEWFRQWAAWGWIVDVVIQQ